LETLMWLLNILKVIVGLGFVIFIHELGHFLLAKWNGVKVEKFSIGFGTTIFGFRRGETEYVIAAIPLGGFVKMLGEGPDEESSQSTDPRAYPNKSVGARMAIISAGVIMNVFLGLACFVYAYGHGMEVKPAKVGGVLPGSPAYRAGLLVGDDVEEIDGRRDVSYITLMLKVSLSGPGQVLRFGVQRPGHDEMITMDIQPVREANNDRPTIGVLPGESLSSGGFLALPGMEAPPAYPGLERRKSHPFVDTLIAAGPADGELTPLTTIEEYDRLLNQNLNRSVKHVLERRAASAGEDGPVSERIELTLPPVHFLDFGLQLAAEPISAIRAGSPAEAAGFRRGDRIVKVDGRDLDPMRLPNQCLDNAGKPMTFEIERAAARGERKTQTIVVTPDDTPPWTERILVGDQLDIPGLGFCIPVSTHVVAVQPDSPAARAGLKAGDVINSMTLKPPKLSKGAGKSPSSSGRPQTFDFDSRATGWVSAFWFLQLQHWEVELIVNKASEPVRITPVPDPNWYYPLRGLEFLDLSRKLPPQPIASALRRGFDDTIETTLSIYAMLRSLFTGRVSFNSMGGLIPITTVAYTAARLGLTYLIHFLGILSINLAVLNFLPIPPLDGGQMVFLLAEKVRGRPLPASALIAGTWLGVFLVLGLIVFVNLKDIFQLVKDYFF
jgi:regulator of sigma E protease